MIVSMRCGAASIRPGDHPSLFLRLFVHFKPFLSNNEAISQQRERIFPLARPHVRSLCFLHVSVQAQAVGWI